MNIKLWKRSSAAGLKLYITHLDGSWQASLWNMSGPRAVLVYVAHARDPRKLKRRLRRAGWIK